MKDFIHNISDTKLKKVVLVIITIILLNFLITIITGRNIIASAYNYLANLVTGYNSEVKTIEIKSPDFDSNTQGSYKITKQADWTDTYKAEVNLSLLSKTYYTESTKDVIFVLDNSIPVCNDTNRNIINNIFRIITNRNDQAAIVTFDDTAYIKNTFSNNYAILSNIVNNFTCPTSNNNNYYDAFKKISSLLENSSKTKDIQVVFITDGYPNINTPNEVGEYEIIKSKYPNVTIDAIQYNLGSNVISEIDNISDNVYIADRNNFSNILNQVIINPVSFDYFEVREYLDDNYYTFTNNYKMSKGTVSITTENNKPVLIWRIDADFLSGNDETLSYEIEVVSNKKDSSGFYPINTNTKVLSRLMGMSTYEQNDTNTLVLKAGYDVNIDANIPSDCSDTYTDNLKYYYSSQVTKPTNIPTCEGYQFKGWEVVEKDVQNINDESFIMPTHDVNIKGTWSKLSIEKSMEGTVFEKTTLYRTIAKMAITDNKSSAYVSSSTGVNFKNTSSDSNGKGVYTISSTLNNTYPIHYFRGDIDYNNVIFGGFCWKMLRTTDTGGIKLVYNGTPTNGTCNGIVSATIIENSSSDPTSPEFVGYMHGSGSRTSSYTLNRLWHEALSFTGKSFRSLAGTNYIFGKNATYNNGVYTITDGVTHSWDSDYKNLIDYVSCFSESNTCTEVYYITDTAQNYAYAKTIKDGKTIESLKAEASQKHFVLGDSYTYSNGNYILNNPTNLYVTNSDMSLVPQKRYTCLSGSNSCTSLAYIYKIKSDTIYYIDLGGKTLDDKLNNITNSPNTVNSTFKNQVDNWYRLNLLSYESYLEDTIFCNDRTVANFAGWKSTGSYSEDFTYAPYNRLKNGTPSLACPLNDSFSKTNIGNGKLTYPVGLMTVDELMYAGYNSSSDVKTYLTTSPKANETSFAYKLEVYTMSPRMFSDNTAQSYTLRAGNSSVKFCNKACPYSFRPVVSLKNSTEYASGDGTTSNPYIIS